jgi:hypothetical protein
MVLERPETIQKALEILAKAGGTIDVVAFAQRMWPSTHPGWTRTPKQRGGKPGARMFGAAGSLLGRLRARDWLVQKVGKHTWRLTERGWDHYRAGVARPPLPPSAKPRHERSAPPDDQPFAYAQGRWYPVREATPCAPGWRRVTWMNGAQSVLPEAAIQRRAS